MYSTLYSVLKFLDEIANKYDNEKERSLMFTKSMLGKALWQKHCSSLLFTAEICEMFCPGCR